MKASSTSPPLRSGKWTPEEEEFANVLIDEFKAGSLPALPEGTSMRGFLAKMLRCVPKRVSKKFENTNYNGKQQYIRDKSITAHEAVHRRLKLDRLERAFLQSISGGDHQYLPHNPLAVAGWPQHPSDVLPASASLLHRASFGIGSASAIASNVKKRSRSSQWGESLAVDSLTNAELEVTRAATDGALDAVQSQYLSSFAGAPGPMAGAAGIGALGNHHLDPINSASGLLAQGPAGMLAGAGGGMFDQGMGMGMGMGGMLPQSRSMPSESFRSASLMGSSLGQFGGGPLSNSLLLGDRPASQSSSMSSIASLGALQQQEAVLQQQRRLSQQQQHQRLQQQQIQAEEESRFLQLQMELQLQQQQQNIRRRSLMDAARRSSASSSSSIPAKLAALRAASPPGSRSSSVGQKDITTRPTLAIPASTSRADPPATGVPGTGFLPNLSSPATTNTSITNSPNAGAVLLKQQLELERQTRLMLSSTSARGGFPVGGQHLLGSHDLDGMAAHLSIATDNSGMMGLRDQLLSRRQRGFIGDCKQREDIDEEDRSVGKSAKRRLA